MESCGPEYPKDDWNHSCIHPKTVAYSCGKPVRPGLPNDHDHDPDEIAICRTLSYEAAQIIGDVGVNFSEAPSTMSPFFITGNRNAKVPAALTAGVVRALFGDTIYPQARVFVEPPKEGSRCWQNFVDNDDRPESRMTPSEREYLRLSLEADRQMTKHRIDRWKAVLRWFESRQELHGTSFVMIGEGRLSETNFGCVFPRLVLSVTRLGSVVGLCGHAVKT
jgi:hypothetical protein